MGTKLSAVQAARLTGRNERRIRDWIVTQRLPATKVGQSWQIDIEDLERLPGIKIDHTQLALLQTQDTEITSPLLDRIARLEQGIAELRSELGALNSRLDRIEQQALIDHSPLDLYTSERSPLSLEDYTPGYTAGYVSGNAGNAGQEGEALSPGSVRMKQFALMHKVHAAVLNYQIETGKIEDTQVYAANGRKSHWLTPQQQYAVITFWRRNGTRFSPCVLCPHSEQATDMLS